MSFIFKAISCVMGLIIAATSQAEIRTSVSPEFSNGLHSHYLIYLANKVKMEIDIQPMPFARRVKQFENGKLDILVGLIRRKEGNDKFIYLTPGYENLTSSFFILKENKNRLLHSKDLNNLVVGVTIGSKYFDNFEQRQEITRVEVNALKQKIGLLLKNRIGTFLHYRQSTLIKLAEGSLQDKIVLADYQPKVYESHHFVITKESRLFTMKDRLEKIIENGVKSGDFQKIRQAYYANKALR